jgi:cysteinyl-tRNA synthetase
MVPYSDCLPLLELCNTMTRQVEPFVPRTDREVLMYTCGPSVYRRPHIGNYRTFLFEDLLKRYLEYLGYKVNRLLTLTDLEDKALAEAEASKVSVEKLTKKVVERFFSELRFLRMGVPELAPRSSTTVNQAAKLIRILLEKGCAYWHGGNVYFDPLKFKGFGKLSRLDMSLWPKKRRRFHRDNYPGTPWNRGDFILWHVHRRSDKVCWDTEIGRGWPAWNVQDAAMVTNCLGFTIDVACGGIDNLVRHHDYTIAIVESAKDGEEEFAHYWLHGGHLLVDGKKMSKSKGNVYYPDDLLARGYSAEHIRFFLMYGYYRDRLNFTFTKMEDRKLRLDAVRAMIRCLAETRGAEPSTDAAELVKEIVARFEKNMNDDLHVSEAFDDISHIVSRLHELNMGGRLSHEDAEDALANLRRIDQVFQVLF